jgi:xeroderma pigmentosum group C-complementing protein
LYAHHQTSLYIPKPVIDGQIPRNAFGNLDLYTSSMVPPGSVHVRAIEGARAAKILNVDFADAVTGFKFQGRRGTAIVDGVVIPADCCEAMVETILGLRWQAEHDAAQKRAREAERMWKKFFLGLRVRERIMGYEVEGEDKTSDVDQQIKEQMEEVDRENDTRIGSGGFMPDADQAEIAQPTGREVLTQGDEALDPTVDINAFADSKYSKETSSEDSSIVVVVRSPWDEGGSLYHVNPNRPPTTEEPSISQPRKRPQLPRTHTPGLFLSPTRPDHELEDGGGFFPDGGASRIIGPGVDENFMGEHHSKDELLDGHNAAMMQDADNEHDDLFEEDPTTEREEEQKSVPIERAGRDDDMPDSIDAASGISKDKATSSQSSQSKQRRKKAETDDGTISETSLLSHDEEDEEMEPDWLVDEIGW